MTNDIALAAQEIAKIIPHCPSCGGDRYYSVTENAGEDFRLKALRCEACEFDILGAFHNIMPTSRQHNDAPILFAILACLAALELAFLVEVLMTE